VSEKLEHALKHLSDALGTLENSIADMPAMPASAADDDMLKQHIHDIETMMAEAIALLEHAMSDQDQQLSAHPLIRMINDEMDIEARRELMRGMWRVAYADGELEKHEEYHLRKTADWLYLSHTDFMKSKHAVMDELDIPHEV